MAEFLLVVVVVMGIVAWQDGRKSIPSELNKRASYHLLCYCP